MAEQYLQQPDGKWAIYSTCSDRLEAIDFTEEELVALAVKEASERAERETREYLNKKRDGGKASQFSVDWDEAVAMTKRHPHKDKEFMAAILAIGGE